MSHTLLSADTEVVLLLCGRFGGERQEPYQPLSARDYGELAKWLNTRKLRPADLITELGQAQLQDVHQVKLERTRLDFLMGRGTAMALALERWNRVGLWVISRGDVEFPKRLKRHLRHTAPPLLYGAGKKDLLDIGGLAIIGSRDASKSALDYTRDVAARCAYEGMGVVSGGARGVDTAAMQGAIDAGGYAIGVLASDLIKSSVHRQNRMGLQEGHLVLVSPFYPEAAFNVGNAMGRNKYIYALADRALVIDSALESGGTWEGAQEALNQKWVPLYVRTPGQGPGNAALVEKGGIPFTFISEQGLSLSDALAGESSLVRNNTESPNELQQTAPNSDVSALNHLETNGHEPIPVIEEMPQPDLAGDAIENNQIETAAVLAIKSTPESDSLDMYQDFVNKISRALTSAPLSDEQIAECLGIEKSQAKAWLAKALIENRIEKLKKPVRYSLTPQSLLLS